ncbi:hypothetical protein N665_0508s0012 [Sinapis alba]|nr:hypothetical protein N665_0508s0012 [Sinapis alba]
MKQQIWWVMNILHTFIFLGVCVWRCAHPWFCCIGSVSLVTVIVSACCSDFPAQVIGFRASVLLAPCRGRR